MLLCNVFSACQKSPSDLIVGSWKNENSDVTIEFLEDGSVVMPDDSGVHYSLNENGTKLILYQDELHTSYVVLGSNEPYTMDISITKEQITLTMEGQEVVFNRIQ